MRGPLLLLATLFLCRKVDGTSEDDFENSLAAQISAQVESQVQASVAAAAPGIVSSSANAAINQQLSTFTVNQPAATQAVQAPAATQQAATQQAAQPVATAQAPAVANTPVATQQGAVGRTTTVAAPEATTLSTQTVAKPGSSGQQLSGVSDSADVVVTTLPDGSVVTITGVSSIPSSVVSTSRNTLTTTQGSTNGSGSSAAHVKTATTGNTDIYGNNTIHSTSGLSKGAFIGLGIGLGFFAILLLVAFFAFRWWSKRRQTQRHGRTPSIVISGPLDEDLKPIRSDSSRTALSETETLTGGAMEMEHTPSLASRSPVSPWTPGSAGATQPNIFELVGSGPVEMAGSQVGSEVAGSSTQVEMEGSPVNEESKQLSPVVEEPESANPRPFSFQTTPVEAFTPYIRTKGSEEMHVSER